MPKESWVVWVLVVLVALLAYDRFVKKLNISFGGSTTTTAVAPVATPTVSTIDQQAIASLADDASV